MGTGSSIKRANRGGTRREVHAQMLELNAQSIPPPIRHREIVRHFDELAPGEAFVLVNSHAPRPLLKQFQSLRPNAFEWNVLESGPVVFRVEIQKRVQPQARTAHELLAADHRRLDALLTQALAAREAARVELFRFFAVGLTRHMHMEEGELFPVFERLAGTPGPTAVMQHEHQLFRTALTECFAANFGNFEQRTTALVQALGAHNLKEESVIYPIVDAHLPEPERAALVLAMQACDA